MTRYLTAAAAGVVFTFTGHPNGLRLLVGLAITNLTLWAWTHLTKEAAA